MCASVDEKLQQDLDEAVAMLDTRKQELQELRQAVQLSPSDLQEARSQLEALNLDVQEKRARVDDAAKKVQDQRIHDLAVFLRERIEKYISAGTIGRSSFAAAMRQEFETLRRSNMGDPILYAIGYVYVYHTQRILGRHGVGVHQISGYVEEARARMHKFSEVTGAIGSGVQLLRAQYKLSKDSQAQQMEGANSSKLSDSDREWFEKNAQRRMLHIIWTLTKNDIEDTLRGVIDLILLSEESHSDSSRFAAPDDIEHSSSLPAAALIYAEAIAFIGNIFLEAMEFDHFICKDDPPSSMEKLTRDIDDKVRQAGIDVDVIRQRTKEARQSTAIAAQEAAAVAGNAINKLFGWSRSTPTAPVRR
jgi:hypothetical protein